MVARLAASQRARPHRSSVAYDLRAAAGNGACAETVDAENLNTDEPMRKIIMLAAAMAFLPMAAGAQSGGTTVTDPTRTDTSRLGQPSNPNAGTSGNKNSTSSQNAPTTGEAAGRNNPSVSRAPDNAPSRGTPQQ